MKTVTQALADILAQAHEEDRETIRAAFMAGASIAMANLSYALDHGMHPCEAMERLLIEIVPPPTEKGRVM